MTMSGKELVKKAQEAGWEIDRIASDHYIMVKGKQTVSIPVTQGNLDIPRPSDIRDVSSEEGIVTVVATEPLAYRKSTRSVKKTLTIPEWLNIEAEKRHINFSSVLQQALIARIE